MPTRAPRTCPIAGCPAITSGRRCTTHQRTPPLTPPRPRRPSSTALGYDRAWRKLSERIRRQRPWCETCGARRSKHVDHIDGDVTNCTEANLLALCIPCHSRKTAIHDGGFGQPRTPRPGRGKSLTGRTSNARG